MNTDTFYHIYNHANGDDNLFKEEKNYDYFLKKYHQHIDKIADTITWCLMPNHFHLLIKIKSEEELTSSFPKFKTLEKIEEKSNFISKQFSNFFSCYTQSFNKVYNRRGSLFIKNFKRKEIIDEEYLFNIILYIHLNPLKHCFTNDINDWKWNSFDTFQFYKVDLFNYLFGNIDNYLKIHREKAIVFKEFENLESDII